ncbi:tRNA pseudouridine(38-40) synthase TruA, partial [Mesorhizobium sp. M7A.F.Ca.CA.002.11.2.1]
RLDIEYDGSLFAGWQHQADQPSVQQAIEQAIEKFCGEAIRLRGRMHAGIGAAGARIAILKATVVSDSFDARFSAIGRHYLYRILNRRAPAAL